MNHLISFDLPRFYSSCLARVFQYSLIFAIVKTIFIRQHEIQTHIDFADLSGGLFII